MLLDKLLDKKGIKFENLTPEEKETLFIWESQLQKGKLTIERVKDNILQMKAAVENELTNTEHNSNKDLYLKARLKNYLLLEGLLTSADRAKQEIDKAVNRLAKK